MHNPILGILRYLLFVYILKVYYLQILAVALCLVCFIIYEYTVIVNYCC